MTEAELDLWSRAAIMAGVLYDFKHRAFVRYAETWGESAALSLASMRRGLAGTERLGRSLKGMVGTQIARTISLSHYRTISQFPATNSKVNLPTRLELAPASGSLSMALTM